MSRARRRPVAVVAMICLAALAGCAVRQHADLALQDPVAESESAETRLAAAAERFREGDYLEASTLLAEAMRSDASYRVMPELLYLLGQSELAMGDARRAAAGFELLRAYYPRRWSALIDRDDLSSIIEEHGPGHGPARPLDDDLFSRPGDPNEVARPTAASGPLISNLFYETDVQQVLADISAQVGVPIVAAAGVRGLVTMEVSDLPLEECLRRLTVPLGLGYKWMNGYYLVGPTDPQDSGSVLLTETLEVRPRHLLAKDALSVLPKGYEKYVRAGGAGGNTLTVTGSPEVVTALVRDLAAVDHPPRQVMLEALVVEVNRDATRELGIDWEVLGGKDGDSFRIAKLASASGDSSFVAGLLDAGVKGFGDVTDIRAALRALEASGGARVKANPRIATLDGREARIRVGSEAYYSLLSGSVSYAYYTLQKIATGTTLKITPYIGASSEIIADIAVEVSDVRAAGTNDLPVTSVREVQTSARVDNGESIMIGGLLSEAERTKESRVPILGRIPVLGALFGYTGVETGQSEMFVLVTPYIMIHPGELAGLLE